MSCALLIENLTCQYDAQTVLKSLSLQVNPGEIVCLLGASGCGKTTLLKAIKACCLWLLVSLALTVSPWMTVNAGCPLSSAISE